MPPLTYEEFPLSIIVLAYLATAILFIIMIMLLRLNSNITALSAKLSRSSRSAKLEEPDAAANAVEVGSGSIFEQFLNEDPNRRSLTKKEQFKAYRAWRADKGLNWSTKD